MPSVSVMAVHRLGTAAPENQVTQVGPFGIEAAATSIQVPPDAMSAVDQPQIATETSQGEPKRLVIGGVLVGSALTIVGGLPDQDEA